MDERIRKEIVREVGEQVVKMGNSVTQSNLEVMHSIERSQVETRKLLDEHIKVSLENQKIVADLGNKIKGYHDEDKAMSIKLREDSAKVRIMFGAWEKMKWSKALGWWFLKAALWILGFTLTALEVKKLINQP